MLVKPVAAVTVASLFLPLASGQMQVGPKDPFAAMPLPTTAAYRVQDNVEGSYVNLNTIAVRPMVQTANGDLYVANTHDSTVEVFDGTLSTPQKVYPMPWGPTSLAVWDAPGDSPDELLVVCRGSYTLARMDLNSGRLLSLLDLPALPGDLLVDDAKSRAFISCSGLDSVVQVDLTTNTIEITYDEANFPGFAVKHPLFLSFDDQGRVLVSPLVSGNNTTSERGGPLRAGNQVIDLTDPMISNKGLPDEDLFRIDPTTGMESVTAVAKGVGTILFAGGFHPLTGDFWQLNTDAINADPVKQTEPAVNGIFSENRVSLLTPSVALATPHTFVDLDLASTAGAGPIDPARTVGQPYALAFRSTGEVCIAGLLTDNIMVLDQNGGFLDEWDVPAGSIPRQILFDSTEDELFVYCWGTNEVRSHKLDGTLVQAFSLNHDPTPADVREGRELFYDASFSLNNNLTCATCHVEGHSDFLVWNLSAGPTDDKGPMMTQTLSGISRTAPFHWRGERPELVDFNGAFAELLGGQELDEVTEFPKFEAFVFSVNPPANPYQNSDRLLDDNIVPPRLAPGAGASAVIGQDSWFDEVTFGTRTCNQCHMQPMGTSNDIFPDDPIHRKPKRGRFKNASFQEAFTRNFMNLVDAEIYKDPNDHSKGFEDEPRAYLGASQSHAGLVKDLLTFVGAVGQVGNDPQLQNNITSYIFQQDSGLAPKVHKAVLLDSTLAALPELRGNLVRHALIRNCGIAVFGDYDDGSTIRPMRWFYHRGTQRFLAEDPAVPSRTLNQFFTNAATETNVFVGLPVGMAERFGVDYDMDGLYNVVDPNPLVPDTVTDTTDPTFVKVPMKQWNTAKVAKLRFETDEPTTYRVAISSNAGVADPPDVVGDLYSKAHSVVIRDLLPSTASDNLPHYTAKDITYTMTVTATDRAGNSTSAVVSPFDTSSFVDESNRHDDHIVGGLSWSTESFVGSTFSGQADAFIDYKYGGPPAVPAADRLVVARILVDGQVSDDWVATGTRSFRADVVRCVNGTDVSRLNIEGPFLISANSGPDGFTALSFNAFNLSAGQTVTFVIEAVVEVDTSLQGQLAADLNATNDCTLTLTNFDFDCDDDTILDCCSLDLPVTGGTDRNWTRWSFADTPKEFRQIESDL